MISKCIVVLLALTLLRPSHLTSVGAKCQPPTIDWEAVDGARQINSNSPDGKRTFLVLNQVCVDQEEIIVYDPEVIASHPGEEGLPSMDLSRTAYYFRHADAAAVASAVGTAGRNHGPELSDPDDNGEKSKNKKAAASGNVVVSAEKPVLGSSLPHDRLHVRMPAKAELDNIPSEFSSCTVPIVIHTMWSMNLAEFWSRVPSMLAMFQTKPQMFDDGVSLVLATPDKLPLEPFNVNLMKPFTRYQPVSFSDFSSRLPSDAASNSTAERRHVRCFEKLIVWRALDGSYPAMATAATVIKKYYQPLLPQVHAWDGGGLGPEVLRVLIEQRPNANARQFLELDQLLRECNADGKISVPGSRYTSVHCYSRTLGNDFLEDMAVVRQANVFVSFHGAGQNNALLMDSGSAMIEVRPREFGTKYKGMPNVWQPLIGDQTQNAFFWFGLNIENSELSPNSKLETSGVQTDQVLNARDRFIILRWPHLKHMLNIVAEVNGSRDAYKLRWPRKVAFTVTQDNEVQDHGDLFRDGATRRISNRRQLL